MATAQYKLDSKFGDFFLIADEKVLISVSTKRDPKTPLVPELNGEHRILRAAVDQLTEYFMGIRKNFDLPLSAKGTDFQKRVWNQLIRIPYGKTASYGDIAKQLKKGKAQRAVGSANGRNPLCIVVPCHRVIASDGNLGGYSAGLKLKRQLLKLEAGAN